MIDFKRVNEKTVKQITKKSFDKHIYRNNEWTGECRPKSGVVLSKLQFWWKRIDFDSVCCGDVVCVVFLVRCWGCSNHTQTIFLFY